MRASVATFLGLGLAALVACGTQTASSPDAAPVVDGATCIGPTPPSAAWSASPGPLVPTTDADTDPIADGSADDAASDADPDAASADAADGAEAAPDPTDPRTPGSAAPLYALRDVQPLSCGFKATYGLPPFKGKVTIAALLAGW